MSDNIPFDIQMEVIKKIHDVKTLFQFRPVSKRWKSFIDSSQFIKGYGFRHTQPRSFILRYIDRYTDVVKYFHLVEDHDTNETFKVQQQEITLAVVSPLIKHFSSTRFVGASHGLVCLFCIVKKMLVIWNPSIRRSFGIVVPNHSFSWREYFYSFGVCPDTSDPTIVKIVQVPHTPWDVEVFTLSLGVWNVIPSSNLLGESIQLTSSRQGVVTDRFIYWAAFDNSFTYDKWMVVSFDLISKEFKVIDLPDSLTHELRTCSVSKLRESLVVYGLKVEGAGGGCDVWVMEHDLSFKKLFSIGARVSTILGFTESGDPIFENVKGSFNTLDVYDSCSQQINSLGFDGVSGTFGMGSNKESLLLLNHSDLHIYYDDN